MKKITCLLLLLALMAGLFGCEKENEVITSDSIDNSEVSSSEISQSVNYELIGEPVTFDDDGYLNDYDTISIDIPSDIAEEDYYLLMGVYIGEDYTYYYLPDPEALQNGKVEYETLHHSTQGAAKVDKETLIKEWTKRASVNIVTKNDANVQLEDTLGDVVNDVLDGLNLGSDDYGGKVLEYILSQDTKGEILQAALNGDQTTMQQKTASLIADAIFDNAIISGGDAVDIVNAYRNEDNWAEGAVALSKEIQKKIFPEIDAATKFADLVDKTFDVWAENAMDEVYRAKYITRSVDANGHISDNDWQEIYSCIRGAWARYNSKGISEDDLRNSFEKRAKNEKLIAEKEEELKKLTEEWDKSGLLTYSSFSDYTDWTIADRLASLYNSRQTIIKMFTKDGKLQKGVYSNWTDDEFIDYVQDMWTRCGVKKRNEFYKWLVTEKIVKEPEFKENYAWCLVNTEIYQHENLDDSYIETFTASATSHTYDIAGKKNYADQKGSFVATCDAPPETLYPDTEFSLHMSITASGKSDYYFIANSWVTFNGSHMATKDGEDTFTVGTFDGADRNFDVTLYATPQAGGEGSTMQIKFCACQSDTTWTYEWKKVGN